MGVSPRLSARISFDGFWLLLGQIMKHISHLKSLANKRAFLVLIDTFRLALIIQAGMKLLEGVLYKPSVKCA